jgi:Tol biopolymer transport system component
MSGSRTWVMLACLAWAFGAVGGAWSDPLIGGTIVYVQAGEAYEVYVMDATVGEPRRVWREEDDEITGVKLSPDARRVAFVAGPDRQDKQVYIVNVDGSDHRPVTDFGEGLWAASVAWSPDNMRLAYASEASLGVHATLSVAARDGSDARVLTRVQSARMSGLDWSRGTEEISYVYRGGAGRTQLRLLSLATEDTAWLANDVVGETAWSPGGTRLAYTRELGNGIRNVLVMRASPRAPSQRVTHADVSAGSPTWVDRQHLAHLSVADVRVIHITDLTGEPQPPLVVKATSPITSFDWVDPARAVRAAGKVATMFGELKAGGGTR